MLTYKNALELAKENNMKSIGVTYGFGSEEELKTAGANYIAHNAEELKNIIDDAKQKTDSNNVKAEISSDALIPETTILSIE